MREEKTGNCGSETLCIGQMNAKHSKPICVPHVLWLPSFQRSMEHPVSAIFICRSDPSWRPRALLSRMWLGHDGRSSLEKVMEKGVSFAGHAIGIVGTFRKGTLAPILSQIRSTCPVVYGLWRNIGMRTPLNLPQILIFPCSKRGTSGPFQFQFHCPLRILSWSRLKSGWWT